MKKKILLLFLLLMVIVFAIFFYFISRNKNKTIKIVAVATMRGISAGVETVNGMKIALKENNNLGKDYKESNYFTGDYTIELEVMDNGDENGLWRDYLEKEIVERAVADKDVLVYLGPIDSGASKISIPVTNKAGLAQISSINTWPGLTQPGFAIGEPGIFYPTGVRNYFRVCPTDSLQGVYGAVWAKEMGFENILIFDDGESYGRGLAGIFKQKATNLGLNILAHNSFNREDDLLLTEIALVQELKPDLVYFSGTTSIGLISLINSISDLNMGIKFMGVDGIMDQALIDQTGRNSEGLMLTSVGLPIEEIDNDKARQFYKNYYAEYGEHPTIYSGFGYEAMSAALMAINRIDSPDRKKVIDELSSLDNFSGLFGQWGFDSNGDTSLSLISANVVKEGKFVFEKLLK